VGLERGPLSLLTTTDELLGRKSSGSGLENPDYGLGDPPSCQRDTPLSAKVGINFADRRRSLCRYISIADSGQGVCFLFLFGVTVAGNWVPLVLRVSMVPVSRRHDIRAFFMVFLTLFKQITIILQIMTCPILLFPINM
jgi:hypothetical protein